MGFAGIVGEVLILLAIYTACIYAMVKYIVAKAEVRIRDNWQSRLLFQVTAAKHAKEHVA